MSRLVFNSKHDEISKILRNVIIILPYDKAIPWTALAALAVKNATIPAFQGNLVTTAGIF